MSNATQYRLKPIIQPTIFGEWWDAIQAHPVSKPKPTIKHLRKWTGFTQSEVTESMKVLWDGVGEQPFGIDVLSAVKICRGMQTEFWYIPVTCVSLCCHKQTPIR